MIGRHSVYRVSCDRCGATVAESHQRWAARDAAFRMGCSICTDGRCLCPECRREVRYLPRFPALRQSRYNEFYL